MTTENYGKRYCLQCGAEFIAHYMTQLCCSYECKRDRRNAQRRRYGVAYRKKYAITIKSCREVIENYKTQVVLLEGRLREADDTVEALRQQLKSVETKRKELAEQMMGQIRNQKPRVPTQEDVNTLLSGLDTSKESHTPPEVDEKQKDIEESLKRAQKEARAALESRMLTCERLHTRATTLPCGNYNECYYPKPCEHLKKKRKK